MHQYCALVQLMWHVRADVHRFTWPQQRAAAATRASLQLVQSKMIVKAIARQKDRRGLGGRLKSRLIPTAVNQPTHARTHVGEYTAAHQSPIIDNLLNIIVPLHLPITPSPKLQTAAAK